MTAWRMTMRCGDNGHEMWEERFALGIVTDEFGDSGNVPRRSEKPG